MTDTQIRNAVEMAAGLLAAVGEERMGRQEMLEQIEAAEPWLARAKSILEGKPPQDNPTCWVCGHTLYPECGGEVSIFRVGV